MIKKIEINNKGIGLIEVVAALAVSTLVTTSLVALTIFTLRTSLKTKLLLESSKLVTQEMEMIRAYRDSNIWSDFRDIMLTNCKTSQNKPVCYMDKDASTGAITVKSDVYISDGSTAATITTDNVNGSKVARGFYVTDDSTDTPGTPIKINVVIQWNDSGEIKKNTMRADFTNWQEK